MATIVISIKIGPGEKKTTYRDFLKWWGTQIIPNWTILVLSAFENYDFGDPLVQKIQSADPGR